MSYRRQQRHSIELRAMLRIPSTRLETPCEVTDISAGGVGLRFRHLIQVVTPNQAAWLRIGGVGPLYVTVRWSTIDRAGVSIDAGSPCRPEFLQLVNSVRREDARQASGDVDQRPQKQNDREATPGR